MVEFSQPAVNELTFSESGDHHQGKNTVGKPRLSPLQYIPGSIPGITVYGRVVVAH